MHVSGYQVTSPAPRDLWNNILKSDPNALLTQTPAWTDFLCTTCNYQDTSRLYEIGGRQMVVPMVRVKGVPASLAPQASMPRAWGIGGLLASEPIRSQDVTTIFADLARHPAVSTFWCPNPLLGDVWAAADAPPRAIRTPRLAHVLDLEGGFEYVWTKRFHQSARNAVRKAECCGLVVECDTTGKLAPIYFELMRQAIDRFACQQHEPQALARLRWRWRDPPDRLQKLAETMGEGCRIWVAWCGDQPVAALQVLQGVNAHCTRAATDKDLVGTTHATELLHRYAIEDACKAGCHYYHLGESGSSVCLARFKEKFGAEPYAWADYSLERLPISRIDRGLRKIVKRVVGFKD